MALVLQILGGIVVVIIAIGIGLFLYIKFKFGKWLQLDPDQNHTPLRIHLNEDFVASWMDGNEAVVAHEELQRLGFQRGKSYSIPEMPDVKLTGYFKAPFAAVLYQHTAAGIWADIAVEHEQSELTVTNGPIGSGTDTRPEKEIIWLQGHSLTQMHEAINDKLDVNAQYVSINDENFREYFETSHRKDMAYRARNGGMSHAEFLRHVEEIGKTYSDDDLHEAFVTAKQQEIEHWSETATEEYTETLSDDEHERLYKDIDTVFIVPFTSEPEAYLNYLADMSFIDEESVKKLAEKFRDEKDLFFLFDLLNTGRSPALRAKQIAASDYPLKLKIFGAKYA